MSDTNKRYLSNWNYQASLILTELEKLVIKNGGSIASTWKHTRIPMEITNRTIMEVVHDLEVKQEKFKRVSKELPDEYKEKLNKYKSLNNDFITSYYGNYLYISFVLDGYYYYYQLEDNPFFNFYYDKTEIVTGTVNKNTFLQEDKKDWLNDNFFHCDCSQLDIEKASNYIFNMLIASRTSTKAGKPRMETVYYID